MPAKPILAVTMGDPAGTGPELVIKALVRPELRALCRPVVVGDARVLAGAAAVVGLCPVIEKISSPDGAPNDSGVIPVIDLDNVPRHGFERRKASPAGGHAAYEYICRAVGLVKSGGAHAVVTSAINKAALHAAGHRYDGHTELLAALCGNPKVTMMLAAGNLRVCHVSTHVPLAEAVNRVRAERIVSVIQLARDGVRELGVAEPRIAVAGLNPHAGEGGLFGDEEIRHIAPAVAEARALGIDASGPYAGDTVFFRTLQGQFDCAIAMYHDQGHVAAKMLGIWQGVNITLGLPVIRTSVEHGTDFDNAGTGAGDPRSLLRALELAATMAASRLAATGSAIKAV
jgi:4-hydroxythreonine-4-phosphate dehydrogenase